MKQNWHQWEGNFVSYEARVRAFLCEVVKAERYSKFLDESIHESIRQEYRDTRCKSSLRSQNEEEEKQSRLVMVTNWA